MPFQNLSHRSDKLSCNFWLLLVGKIFCLKFLVAHGNQRMGMHLRLR